MSDPKHIELKTDIPGPKSQTLRSQEDQNLAPGLQGFALMAGITVDHAQGSTVTDVDGNRFIDIIGGIGVNGLGHSHPKWVKAIQDQVARASVGSFSSASRTDLLTKIGEMSRTIGLDRVQLYSSGAEAVESALRLAKCFKNKYEMVSFWGGFHGKTMGALSLMGSEFKHGFGPMVSGSHIVAYADCYRCPLKLKYPSCGLACADLAREQLKNASAGSLAAFIIEPMQGTAGNVIPPDDFLPAIAAIAKEKDALLIVDEMITGFGRTGTMWGANHSGVRPDIATIGKQFGGGYPMSAVLSKKPIVDAKPWSNPSGSSSSYGGNPLGAAASLAALRIIEEEELVNNSNVMGKYFLDQLKPFEERYPFIGEVRGKGLFLAIEMVQDKTTKVPLSKKVTDKIFEAHLRRGLLTMSYAPRFRIQPSMNIDRGTIDESVAVMKDVFDWVAKERLWEMS